MPPASSRPPISAFSRRDFLKLSGACLSTLALPRLGNYGQPLSNQQGRVIPDRATAYRAPTFSASRLRIHWKDNILPILEATIGDAEPSHNRVWYRVSEDSYLHSAVLQPVRTILNQPQGNLPEQGALAEVTVPFTDAHWGRGRSALVAYRFYYGTTHWVMGLERDEQGQEWYRILEDKWDYTLYVLAAHLRIIPGQELAPLSPHVPPASKRLLVLLEQQTLLAFEWDHPVFSARICSGAVFSNGDFSTRPGRYVAIHKRPSRHMAAGDLASNGYDLPGVPWVTYITESGVALHGVYWHNDYGAPRSHGCINLTPQASRWVYLWTMPVVPPDQQYALDTAGTVVDVV